MQKHFQNSSEKVKIFFENNEIEVESGISVAAAVLSSHAHHTRITKKYHNKRAPYCQMGICFECLMRIDGKDNQQACMIEVREGMQIYRQKGCASFASDEVNISKISNNTEEI